MDVTHNSKNSSFFIRLMSWSYSPFLVLGIIILVIHLFMKMGTSDDSWFLQTFNAGDFNAVSYSITRYLQWTSRTILELLLMLFIRMPVILWSILDTISYVIIGIFLSKIFVNKQHRLEANIVIACLMLLFPYNYLSSAGWITTAINYSWPLMFGLISMYPLRKIFDGARFRFREYIMYAVSLLIAANQEQLCFVILVVYCTFAVYMFIRKNINVFALVQLGLCLLSLAYIILCSGNSVRYSQEITNWFPEYNAFTFIQKAELGLSALLSTLFLSDNWIYLAFSFIIFYLVCQKYRGIFYRVVAAIPLLSLVALNTVHPMAEDYDYLNAFFNMAKPYGIINSGNLNSAYSLLSMFLMLFIICCLLISVYMLSGRNTGSLMVIGLFVVGCITKAAIGFSPTIWVSSDRTGVILMFSLIACSSYLLNRWDYTNKDVNRLMLILVIMLCVSGGVYNLVTT